MKKKKVMLSLAAAAMVGTLAVGGTLAWFTDTETATNVVTIGDVDVVWNEDGKDVVGAGKVTNEEKQVAEGLDFGTDIVPGTEFNKDAKIRNVSSNDAYVRAQVKYIINGGEESLVIPNGYDVEIFNGNGSAWEYNEKDNYYYYKGRVKAEGDENENDSTGMLIGKVAVLPTATDSIANQTLKIKLYAEAIQADHVSSEKLVNLEDYVQIFDKKDIANKTSGEWGN